jgi:hypothetical protein
MAILSPEKRAQVIARLEQAADDPRLSPELRKRVERSLHNTKAIQRRLTS